MKSGALITARAVSLFEDIDGPFWLAEDVEVPAGSYRFYTVGAEYDMPSGDLLRTGISADAGSFYDGHRLAVGLVSKWSMSRYVELSGYHQFNRLTFPAR